MSNNTRKRRLFIGTVDDLFRSQSQNTTANQSESEIENFVNGNDDDEFNATIMQLDQIERTNQSSSDVESFFDGCDDIQFNNTLLELHEEELDFHTDGDKFAGKRVKMCNKVSLVRNKCKVQAEKFNFSSELFNRIPMWVFRSITADDPLCKASDTKKSKF